MIRNSVFSEPSEVKLAPRPDPRFFARQPIFTSDEKIFGYEFLFRGTLQDYLAGPYSTASTRSIVDSVNLIGFDVLCDGRRAFINCTRDVLLREYVTLLPAAQTVVELLETVPPDCEVVAACRRLKSAGYLIALDDFTVDDPREPLTDLADIINVNMRVTPPEQIAVVLKRYLRRGCRMLAEKVETMAEFVAAKQMGFHLFQGYFFRKPELLTAAAIPANRINFLLLLQATSAPQLDIQEIENTIKRDPSFCYRLLRYLNSATFGLPSEVHSVRHALSLLGENEVRRWLRVVVMMGAGESKTSDLLLSALVRANFCERLASKIQHSDSDLFLMGLLSLMDAILEIPMASVLESIPVDHEIKKALRGEDSRLRPLYTLMLALESGEWDKAAESTKRLNLTENEVSESYWQAMLWARGVAGS